MKDTLVIITYAPAGLGHLRVTDALFHGLPKDTDSEIIGSYDKSIENIHRFTSIHPVVRKIYEWGQDGPLSFYFTRIYKSVLKGSAETLYKQIIGSINKRSVLPKKVLVVATHFAIAHQLTAIKEKIEKEKNIKIFLIVQVTDDYAHPMWFVEGADLIVVPSHKTKTEFAEIGKKLMLPEVNFAVAPYPISPLLSLPLNTTELTERLDSTAPNREAFINVSIPVSGAAANLIFYKELIDALGRTSSRFIFHVVSRVAPYTKMFLDDISSKGFVKVHSSGNDRELVDSYDEEFKKEVMSLEITKPSEQAFKALVGAESRGGVIMFFSEPFGPQEKNNLDFLERHSLIPNMALNEQLWNLGEITEDLRSQFCGWRGIRLPNNPQKAANFIWWLLENGIFPQMLLCKPGQGKKDPNPDELGSDGVAKFWQIVDNLIKI